MEIKKEINGDSAVVSLSGRLDTTTAPQMEEELSTFLPSLKSLVLDFAELEYLSSAGLRVILSTQKTMSKQGKMVIRHVNDLIMETFDMTGFSSILTFED